MNVRTFAAVALVAFAVFGVPELRTGSVTRTEIQEPSKTMRDVVLPVAKAARSMNAIDRLWLQGIYLNCARVVAADGMVSEPTMTTTDGLRAVHVAVLNYVWKGLAQNSPNKYPGLAEAIDSAINSVLSDDARPLTPELRDSAVEVYRAIAWAGLGKDE